MQYLLKNKLKC